MKAKLTGVKIAEDMAQIMQDFISMIKAEEDFLLATNHKALQVARETCDMNSRAQLKQMAKILRQQVKNQREGRLKLCRGVVDMKLMAMKLKNSPHQAGK